MSLDVRMLTVGPLQENAYLLRPAGGGVGWHLSTEPWTWGGPP